MEAKTTIAGCYVVWCIIHNPGTIALIMSAGGDLARDIATWVIQIINGMDVLSCLVPDKNHATTRTSLEKYDIHHDLKGVNKSASVSCVGITSNMQGKRAHLLLADDVESSKNSYTQLMRDQLLEKTRDFISINRDGKILYLGTPQSTDSIYNTLPGRGYKIRIWPGRYPTEVELENYGGNLAPTILEAMLKDPTLQTEGGILGERGKPTDPHMMSEQQLQDRELDQGPAYFNLQYMLDTELSDADRFPLKSVNMQFMHLDNLEAPGKFMWGPRPDNRIQAPHSDLKLELHSPAKIHTEVFPYETRCLALDPSGESGKNNDECGWAIVFTANGYYYCMAVGGIQNASSEAGQLEIALLAKRWGINQIIVEKNYGGGMFTNLITGTMSAHDHLCGVEEVWSSGQKELRIIHSVDPILSFHRIIFNSSIIQEDFESIQKYPLDKRMQYSFFLQLTKLSRDRGCLIHDDRIEALGIALRFLKDSMKIDTAKKVAGAKTQQMLLWMANPRGITTNNPKKYQKKPIINVNAMQRFNRR